MLPKLEKALQDLRGINSVIRGSELSIKFLCEKDEETDRFDREICVFISCMKNICDAWMEHQYKAIEENDPEFFDFALDIDEDLDLDDEADFDEEEGEE